MAERRHNSLALQWQPCHRLGNNGSRPFVFSQALQGLALNVQTTWQSSRVSRISRHAFLNKKQARGPNNMTQVGNMKAEINGQAKATREFLHKSLTSFQKKIRRITSSFREEAQKKRHCFQRTSKALVLLLPLPGSTHF